MNSDLSDLAELLSFSPSTSEITIEYRTSPLWQAHMRPKLKAAPVHIRSIAIVGLHWYKFYVIPMKLPSSWCYKSSVHFKSKICAIFQRHLSIWNINPSLRLRQLFLKRPPGFRSIKYHFCLRFFATWANQHHYKTSPYDMGWCFGGSVGRHRTILKKNIRKKNNIHSLRIQVEPRQPCYWPSFTSRFWLQHLKASRTLG